MIEPAILAQLWRTHSARLVVVARAIGEPAEDAVQEAFVALATQSQLPDDPLAWLVRVTRNQLLQWLRSSNRRRHRERHVAPVKNWFAGEVELIDRRIDGQQLTEWLNELPAPEREVIVMRLWGELGFREVAAVMDCSAAKANRLYGRGLERLRRKADTQPTKVSS